MKTVDHVIIGGGVVGVCTAYHLAHANQKVLLLERNPQMAPASPLSSSGEEIKLFRCAYGRDRDMTSMSMEALAWWRKFEGASGKALLIPTSWAIFEAERPELLDRWPEYAGPPPGFARKSQAVMASMSLPHEWLTKAELIERFPKIAANDFYDCALLDKTSCLIKAAESVRVIAELAEDAGAEIWTNAGVEEIVREGGRVSRLLTSRGDVVPNKAVIFAAGHMNSALVPELQRKTRIVQERLLLVRPENPAPFKPDCFPVVGRYAFPVFGQGVTKLASGETSHQEGAHVTEKERIMRTLAIIKEWVPDLAEAQVVGNRSGYSTYTANGRYLIYRHGNSVVISACSGTGFKHAPVTGQLAAGLALQSTGAQEFSHPFSLHQFRYESMPDISGLIHQETRRHVS